MPFTQVVRALRLSLLACAISGAALAGQIEIEQFQGKVVRHVDGSGLKVERIMPAETVVPGETVVYGYALHNSGTEAAENVTVGTAIDPNMVYVRGSADAEGWIVEFSTDGGVRFAREDDLKMLDIDGTWRDARPQDVTNVRWQLERPAAAGERLSLSVRATLK